MTTCTYCNLPIKPGREDTRNPNIHGDTIGCAAALKHRVAELEAELTELTDYIQRAYTLRQTLED